MRAKRRQWNTPVATMSDPQERAVEIRKVRWRERSSQPGGCKYQSAIWLTYQFGTPGRLNPGRNGLYCNAHARIALKSAKANGLRILDRREG
jgi:hypothetical protein